MSRMYKCYGTCNEKYPKDVLMQIGNRNYCPDCYNTKIKNDEDRKKLYKLIKDVFQIEFPTGLMLRQIKQFTEERNYTLEYVYWTLKYIYTVKCINIQIKFGLTLVPYYYDEMINYYKELKRKRESTNYKPLETITIKLSPIKIENNYKKDKLINMNNIVGDE